MDAADQLAEQFDGMAAGGGSRSNRGGGGGGQGRGGRGRGRGGRLGQGRGIELSKALSRLLRHQAGNAGIALDAEGFAPLDKVLAWGPVRALGAGLDDIKAAVRDSDKQRFALRLANPDEDDEEGLAAQDAARWLIRANQGHSIKIESEGLLRPLVLGGGEVDGEDKGEKVEKVEKGEKGEKGVPVPPTVVHGTYFAFWPAIVASGGLKSMGRNHVHCSTGVPEDPAGVVSGMRRDAEVLVYVDVAASMRDAGIKWWMSDNGVVLTEGDADGLVPVRFFKEVVGRRQNVGVLWRDGEKVADLPEGLRIQVPMGKGGGRGGGGRGRGERGGKGGRGR
jgi:2'-phosphotransferase